MFRVGIVKDISFSIFFGRRESLVRRCELAWDRAFRPSEVRLIPNV